jgi:nitroimidazol reductase NimA-like FMN-containing flavoprotein (pyridoxamine 5'-phosphate oxidase superfamily)
MNEQTPKIPTGEPRGDFAPTTRTRIKRMPKRAHYDRDTVYAILDAGLIAHVGYNIDGEPYVTPTAYWRKGDHVYWHGSSASRMLRSLEGGSARVCLTVSLLDGFVLARSAFHHSVNYRAVMAFGTAFMVTDKAAKLAAMEDFVERIYPGRWAMLRPVTEQEIKATTVLGMDLSEAVAKVRTGGPVDDEEDYALPIWAGVLPVTTAIGAPVDDARNLPGVARPAHLAHVKVG